MNDLPTTPDAETLRRLRRFVARVQQAGGVSIPHHVIAGLARDVRLDAGVTIDFGAAAELGQPLVVLRIPARAGIPACLSSLTRREMEVAALVGEGLRNKEVAERLGISLATVKDHVHHILTKTELSGRAALIAAYRSRE